MIRIVILLLASVVPTVAYAYDCNTGGWITTIGTEVVAREVPHSPTSYTRYYLATLRCKVTNSATNDGVVERIVHTELDMTPQQVANGAGGSVNMGVFRGMGTPCHTAYYFIHKDFRGTVSNSLEGEPVTIDFRNNTDFPVGAISEAPFNDTFTGGFSSVDMSDYSGWTPPAQVGGAWTFNQTLRNGQVCRSTPYPQNCDLSNGPSTRTGNPIDLLTRQKVQSEQDYEGAGPGGLVYGRTYQSPVLSSQGQGSRSAVGFSAPAERTRLDAIAEPKPAYRVVFPDGRWYIVAQDSQGQWQGDSPRRTLPQPDGQGGYVLAGRDGSEKHFDAEGRVIQETEANGRARYYTYENDRLTTVRNSFGRQLAFAYDVNGRLSTLTDPAGELYQYAYGAAGNLTSVTYPDGATREYLYDDPRDPARLTGVRDENGNLFATFAYNELGEAIHSSHAGGAARQDISYLDDTHIDVREYVDVAAGRHALHRYQLAELDDTRKISLVQSYPCGDSAACAPREERWEYDERGRVRLHKTADGVITEYQYDENDLETRRTVNAGTSQAYEVVTEWDPVTFRRTRVTRPDLVVEYAYDAAGNLIRETRTDPGTGAQRTTNYQYGPLGLLTRVDGPRQDVDDSIEYSYDAQGNLIEVRNALGHVVRITAYDAHGRPLHVDDGNAAIQLSYTPRGWLASRSVDAQVTAYEYTPSGQLQRLRAPDGSVMEYGYDAAQRLTSVQDGDGNRIEYTLDAQGNHIAERVFDPAGNLARRLSREYDALGRLMRHVGAEGQTTAYEHDPSGNHVTITDPLGNVTTRAFDALNRVMQTTDPLGGITREFHDTAGRVVEVVNPNGNATRYAYDGLGNLVRQESPDTGITTFTHDAAGNVLTRTDAKGQITQYTYDALNRIATTTYTDGSTVTYGHDTCSHGIGRLCSLSDASGTTSWEYDSQGHVVSKRQTVDGLTFETAYEYDAAGRLVRMTYPSGLVVGFEYHQGRPTALLINSQPFVTAVTYTPFGTVTGWNWSDGNPAYRTFDLDGRLVAQGLGTAERTLGTAERTLGYDPLGNIVAIHDPVTQLALTYDPLNRLSSATEAAYHQSWTYDPNGNRLTQDENGQLTTYGIEATSNRMVLAGPVSYQYDANGNRVDDGTHSYTFDTSNRLVAVDDGNTARYRYNALGQRVQKTALLEGGGGPDYLALALEAGQRAQQHREQADVLNQQAQASREAADQLLAQAAAARSEAARLNDEAQSLRERAAHEAARAETFASLAESLRQEAADLRARIVPNPKLLQRLLNAVYAGLAELAEALADSAQTRTVPYQQSAAAALAQAADKQQQTLALQAEADAIEQQAQVALNDADTLNDQAQEELQLAQAAEAEAADYRRLAEEGGNLGAPSTTWFVYDEEGRLIGEYDGSGNARQETVWLNGLPVATVQNGQPYAIHTDHLGTPRVITDAQGREVWRWDSDPFGTTLANEDPDGDGNLFAFNLRFPGQYFDAETGLHYNYFRDYDPSLGRYIESDPIGLKGGLNTYVYAFSNPLKYTDPLGLCPANMRPGPNGVCEFTGDNDREVCVTAECAAGLPPVPPPQDLTPEQRCTAACSASAGLTCSYVLRGGMTPANIAAYIVCRAAVAKTCADECKKDSCDQ